MDSQNQQTPEEFHAITAENAQLYSPETPKKSQAFAAFWRTLDRKKQVLVVFGVVFTIFCLFTIALSFAVKSDPSSVATTQPTSSKIITRDTEQTSEQSSDYTDADVSADDVSWWQSLINTIRPKQSNESNTSESTNEETIAISQSAYEDIASIDLSATESNGNVEKEPAVEEQVYAKNISTIIGAPLSVATWNVLKYDNTVSNMREGVKDIFAAGANIVGLQEISSPSFTASSVNKLASSSVGTYSPGGGGALVWNSSYLEKISTSSFAPVSGSSKRFVYGKFKIRSNGQEFYIVSVHMQTGVNSEPASCTTENCKTYKLQIKALVSKLKQLQSESIPVYLVGDFNIDYLKDKACDITWHPCYALRAISVVNSYTTLGFDTIIGSSKKYIDHAYYWKSSQPVPSLVSNKILGSGSKCVQSSVRDIDGDIVIHCWNGSDHKPVLLTSKLVKS